MNIILLAAVIALLALAGMGWADRRARGRRSSLTAADPDGASWAADAESAPMARPTADVVMAAAAAPMVVVVVLGRRRRVS